jgi:hypothetical protein
MSVLLGGSNWVLTVLQCIVLNEGLPCTYVFCLSGSFLKNYILLFVMLYGRCYVLLFYRKWIIILLWYGNTVVSWQTSCRHYWRLFCVDRLHLYNTRCNFISSSDVLKPSPAIVCNIVIIPGKYNLRKVYVNINIRYCVCIHLSLRD